MPPDAPSLHLGHSDSEAMYEVPGSRLRELSDDIARMKKALEDISASIPAGWQDGDRHQQIVYWAIQSGLYGRERP